MCSIVTLKHAFFFSGVNNRASRTKKHDPCFHKAHFITEEKERKEIHNISYIKYFEEKTT